MHLRNAQERTTATRGASQRQTDPTRSATNKNTGEPANAPFPSTNGPSYTFQPPQHLLGAGTDT